MRNRNIGFLKFRRRRGSVFLLVVAMLAVLALLTMTLSYVTRVELRAARNTVEAVQARISVTTGVPDFQPYQNAGGPPPTVSGSSTSNASSISPTIPTQDVVLLNLTIDAKALARSQERSQALQDFQNRQVHPPTGRVPSPVSGAPAPNSRMDPSGAKSPDGSVNSGPVGANLFAGAIAQSVIEDESAKFNVNAVLPSPAHQQIVPAPNQLPDLANPQRLQPAPQPNADHLAAFIDEALRVKGVKGSITGKQLADAIVTYRYGPDGKPGIANVDDNCNSGKIDPGADGIDNDQDWVIDNPEEAAMTPNADGLDNNRDGQIDEAGESIAKDGLDNDHDGVVDNPDEGMDEPAEFSSDFRLPPRGDDRPYTALEDLMAVPGITREIFDAIAPNLTVFSVSQPAYPATLESNSVGVRQIDPNTATAQEIFKALTSKFPHLSPDLIGQFTVNLIDHRDTDDIPTTLQLGTSGKSYTGFEFAPLINEVFPYTGSYDDDNGQFVEIVNPWGKALDLTGWRLEGGGQAIWLKGSLAAGGYLVVTDDYNDSTDPTPSKVPGQGSLYALFGVVPTGLGTQIQVEPLFNLPDDAGTVSLFDKQGVLVDSFPYKDGRLAGGSKRSFQRIQPFDHKDVYDVKDTFPATPLKSNYNAPTQSPQDQTLLKLVSAFQNRPFLTTLDVLMVPAGPQSFASSGNPGTGNGSGGTQTGTDQQSTPLPALAGLADGSGFTMDLLDVFMPLVPPKRPTNPILGALAPGQVELGSTAQVDLTEAKIKALRDAPPALFGRVNLNTASPAVLAALPGLGQDLAYRISQARDLGTQGQNTNGAVVSGSVGADVLNSDRWYQAVAPGANPRWRGMGDFLQDQDIWGQTTMDKRITTVYPFAMMVAFDSLSVKVLSQNIPDPKMAGEQRRQTVLTAERLIAGDRGQPETVTFRLLGTNNHAATDADIRFGVAEGKTTDLAAGIMKQKPFHEVTLPTYNGPVYSRPKNPSELNRNQATGRSAYGGGTTSAPSTGGNQTAH